MVHLVLGMNYVPPTLAKALAAEGFELSAYPAINLIQNTKLASRKSAFLFDLRMDQENSLTAIREIRNVYGYGPAIICLCAKRCTSVTVAALERGADTFLYWEEFDSKVVVASVMGSLRRVRALLNDHDWPSQNYPPFGISKRRLTCSP